MCNMCTRDVTEIAPAAEVPVAAKSSRLLERMKKKHNIVTDPSSSEKQKEVEYQPDLLAVFTKYSKNAYDLLMQGLARLEDTKPYVIATRTSQPLHLALVVLVFLAWCSRPGSTQYLGIWKAIYVVAVATHFGAQVWMIFVSGLVLYFNLPRHVFGQVQTILFPVYYAFNAVVSLLAMLSYYRLQSLTRFQNTSWIQLALLLAVFSIESYVRLRLVSPMLRAKHVKTQMEQAAGGGQEVGSLILGELAHCPRYLRVLKTFRGYHSSIAMGTMIALGCSFSSLLIISDSLCLN